VKDVVYQEKSWTSEELLQQIMESGDRIDEMMKLMRKAANT
jgi:hypothetical protein